MRNNKFLSILLVLLASALVFVSCKQENEDSVTDITKEVVGTYKGFLDLSVGGSSQGVINSTIEITKVNDTNVSIKLSSFDFGPHSINDIISECEVVKLEDGKYKLAGTIESEQKIKITGDYEGTLENKVLSMVYTFNFGGMPMPVICTFSQDVNKGEFTINATKYDEWTYISLSSGKQEVVKIVDGECDEPDFDWDIAIHRYDIKTNKGLAIATNKNNLEDVVELPSGDFEADVKDSVIVDLSQMMEGIVVYAESEVNPVLNTWLERDMSVMPPLYTLSNLVYVLKTKNDLYIKLLFTDYTDENENKGFVTFKYEFMNLK